MNRFIPHYRRLILRLKFQIQRYFLRRADVLVVEHSYIRELLSQQRVFKKSKITVVESAADKIYFDPSKWQDVELPFAQSRFRLGVLSRNYAHKNLSILPEVKRRLLQNHGIDVGIFVTLSDSEWQACSTDMRENLLNVGGLNLSQCPTFISKMDALIFPTLLECFSAFPLEARALGKKLFASDRVFIRKTVHDYPLYFDPLDVDDIVNTVRAGLMSDKGDHWELDRSLHFSLDSRQRTIELMGLLNLDVDRFQPDSKCE
jgi:glycosyltransferase involved in cell wall biosynthesis